MTHLFALSLAFGLVTNLFIYPVKFLLISNTFHTEPEENKFKAPFF